MTDHSDSASDGAPSLAIPMDPDKVFKIISNSRRRRIVLSLSRTDRQHTASDLAVEIAAIENGIDPREVHSDDRTAVYISLTQTHLQKLDDCGVIKYNDQSKAVAPTGTTGPLAEYIRRLRIACYKPDSETNA